MRGATVEAQGAAGGMIISSFLDILLQRYWEGGFHEDLDGGEALDYLK